MRGNERNFLQSHRTINNSITIMILVLLLLCLESQSLTQTLSSKQSIALVLNMNRTEQRLMNYIFNIKSTFESSSRVVYNKTLQQLSDSAERGSKKIQIYNWESSSTILQVSVLPPQQSTSQSQSQLLIDDQMIENLLVEMKVYDLDLQHGIMLTREISEPYILPFNLLPTKNPQIFADESISKLQNFSYEYEPFLETYWNEIGQDKVVMAWLPYFSNCQYESKSFLFLNNIIAPWQTDAYNLQQLHRICSHKNSFIWGGSLNCDNKHIEVKCGLEELSVQNVKKQPWWKNTGKVLYYLVNFNQIGVQLSDIENNQKYLTKLSEQYYKKLIPMRYKANLQLNSESPNVFRLNIQIGNIHDHSRIKIIRAKLTSEWEQLAKTELSKGECYLKIDVQYLDSWDTFLEYGKETYVYYAFCLIVMALQLVALKILFESFNFHIRFLYWGKLLIFPMVKGLFMSYFICLGFILSFYFIAVETKYSSISVNFDGDELSNYWDAYAMRIGMTVFISGYYLLGTGINQSFKVLTLDETKIIIEDNSLEKKNISGSDKLSLVQNIEKDDEEENSEQNFIIKNMKSHRKYIFMCTFSFSFFLLFLYQVLLLFNLETKLITILFGYPVIYKLILITYRHFICKELLYTIPVLVALQCVVDVGCFSDSNLGHTVLFYLCKFISDHIIITALELGSELVALKLHSYLKKGENQDKEPSFIYKIVNHFKQDISNLANECNYQKSVYYSSFFTIRMASFFSRFFLMFLFLISIQYNSVAKDIEQDSSIILKTTSFFLFLWPLQCIMLVLNKKMMQKVFGLKIDKCFQFNKFKFNQRKVKWISDSFTQSRCIQHFYREFQKFCFSSQLYFMTFTICFSLLTLMVGIKIILGVSYIALDDPGTLFIFFIIWLSGDVLTILVNFLVIKLRFYERKENGKTRAKLESIEKILRKTNYSEYLELDAVKRYFLIHCKQWIVKNLTRIFDKEDFTDNNYELLIQYKHYKSLLKKKKIQERRKEQRKEETSNQLNLIKQNEKRAVVKLPKIEFEVLAKPLLLSWLKMARQNIFLKSLVDFLKVEKKRQTCEFCSMNIQLEVIEKNQFSDIVNQYRILNVGRMFIKDHFIEFYKHKQEFMTVCIECKDKKVHLERKFVDMGGVQRRLLLKWLIMARSRLLHKNKQKHVNDKPF